MYSSFHKWIHSWRDLPLKINQWVNIVRWEMRPYPFLRTTEFLWHEAHTAHSTNKEADTQVRQAIKIYKNFFENFLAIPVITGKKSEQEKFAGAVYSMSCEALLIDGKALQVATAHNLGKNFSKIFNITFKNNKEEEKFVWQTSWGLSTRAIGGLILTHMDKKGLVLPPKIAPIQVIIIPIWTNEQGRKNIFKQSKAVIKQLKSINIKSKIDDRRQFTPGWKFNEWELKGAPLRVEIGAKEVKNNTVRIARRDNQTKISIKCNEIKRKIPKLLEQIQNNLFLKAKNFQQKNTHTANSLKKFKKILKENKGFIKAGWCGDKKCENAIKNETKATTRCLLSEKINKNEKCIYCNKPAKYMAIWALSH